MLSRCSCVGVNVEDKVLTPPGYACAVGPRGPPPQSDKEAQQPRLLVHNALHPLHFYKRHQSAFNTHGNKTFLGADSDALSAAPSALFWRRQTLPSMLSRRPAAEAFLQIFQTAHLSPRVLLYKEIFWVMLDAT